MLRFLLCLPAMAITFTAVGGEAGRRAPEPVEQQSDPFVGMTATEATDFQDNGADVEGVRRSPDGLYRIDALVNGARVNFIVDTGSSVVVLTPADARRVGLAGTNAPRVDVATANGASSMRMTVIRDLRIGKDSMTGVQAAIVDQGLPSSLLGQSALAKLETLSIRGGTLKFGS
jgi:clan AA aspartic protease (TIGR02281 family)